MLALLKHKTCVLETFAIIYLETSTLCWLILLIVCIVLHISVINVIMEMLACNTADVKETYILVVVLQVACHW
jgi:hypothetical protein